MSVNEDPFGLRVLLTNVGDRIFVFDMLPVPSKYKELLQIMV